MAAQFSDQDVRTTSVSVTNSAVNALSHNYGPFHYHFQSDEYLYDPLPCQIIRTRSKSMPPRYIPHNYTYACTTPPPPPRPSSFLVANTRSPTPPHFIHNELDTLKSKVARLESELKKHQIELAECRAVNKEIYILMTEFGILICI